MNECGCPVSCLSLLKATLCRIRSAKQQGKEKATTTAAAIEDTEWRKLSIAEAGDSAGFGMNDSREGGGGGGGCCCCPCCCSRRQLSSEIVWEQCWSHHGALIRSRPIYQLLDLQGGGRLVEAYESGGIAGARALILTEVAPFLYNGGAGREVSGAELIAGRLRQVGLASDEAAAPASGMAAGATGPAATIADSLRSSRTAVTTADEVLQDVEDSEDVDSEAREHRKNGVHRRQSVAAQSAATHEVCERQPQPPPPHPPVLEEEQQVPDYLYDCVRPVYPDNSRHRVCWDIEQRGMYGETLLHLCLVCDSPLHRQLAKALLSVFPNLAVDFFIGWEYFGHSSLHMAVMNKDLELVKLLVKCGAVIDQRAVGDFFRPEDQRQVNKAAITDYRGQSYLGEYPLAFACCVGSAEIYDFLLSCGAHPDSKDQFGNSVLHMLVIHNNTEIYRLAVKHHKKPANPKLTNSAGLNPISLAAKLGRKDVFNEIIDLSSSEMWRFANITCKVYPLTGVDTIGQSGRTDWNSAFMYIINGTTDQHLDMLEQGLINQLLYEKWQKYARARFLQRLLMLTIHIIIMSAAIYLRPLKSSSDTSATSSSLESDNSSLTTTASSVASTTTAAAAAVTISTQEVFRYVFECITVVNSLVTLFMHIDEVREQGVLDFLRGLGDAPPKTSFLIACLLISLALPVRIMSLLWTSNLETLTNAEETLLIIAAPCVWIYLLFFAGGTQLNGTFVTMIYKMIKGDMARFGIIYSIILVCFAQTYYFLFRDIDPNVSSVLSFSQPHTTVMTLLQMTLGDFKYDEFNYTNYTPLAKFVFAAFLILVPILLLNMLIAMMGNTYNLVNSRSQKEWIAMWAKIIVILERSYSPKQLLKFQSEYTIPVPGKDGEVGLMTILRTKKTLAFLRRTASNNWKRSCRKVLQLLRDHRASGSTRPFTFDGSEESLDTLRQQRARLIGLQKSVVRTQRYARVLKKMETSAMDSSVSAMQQDLEQSIDEILETVPDADGSSSAADKPQQQQHSLPKLSNSAFHILAAQDSPKTISLRSMVKRPPLVKQLSSFDDENSLLESVDSAISASDSKPADRSDSASSSKTLISGGGKPTGGGGGGGGGAASASSSAAASRSRLGQGAGAATKAALSIKKTLKRAKSPAKN
ncbi:hypothetical protein BOX15_Mlig006500g2 [Macrostomum lignano]|uniref:Ion transport domain-containing protein n=1 Tax=Macrostomum lignano TaxID=282301 RepID=A0A267H584_9PLAT|nr:hypothetical protein BOX15_Mlig006500g2 [Macrostomum lignano]